MAIVAMCAATYVAISFAAQTSDVTTAPLSFAAQTSDVTTAPLRMPQSKLTASRHPSTSEELIAAALKAGTITMRNRFAKEPCALR